jgi:hypothetical protein
MTSTEPVAPGIAKPFRVHWYDERACTGDDGGQRDRGHWVARSGSWAQPKRRESPARWRASAIAALLCDGTGRIRRHQSVGSDRSLRDDGEGQRGRGGTGERTLPSLKPLIREWAAALRRAPRTKPCRPPSTVTLTGCDGELRHDDGFVHRQTQPGLLWAVPAALVALSRYDPAEARVTAFNVSVVDVAPAIGAPSFVHW